MSGSAKPSQDDLSLAALRAGGKLALARALAALERAPESAGAIALLDGAHRAPRARVIGVTGPPGVGKSTLLRTIIGRFRGAGATVGVIAVDPSSRRTGGALLGDRVRLATDPEDTGLFVRSMAARDRLGGLAEGTMAAMVLMRAIFDRVLIETVGVGQSETDVAGMADTMVFCVQPASGDSLQFMKAGIVESPDIAVITKGDLGAPARRAVADLKGALSLAVAPGPEAWPVEVHLVSAASGLGIDDLMAGLARRAAWLARENRLAARRHAQAEAWLTATLRERIGRDGLRRLRAKGALPTLPEGASPFATLAALMHEEPD